MTPSKAIAGPGTPKWIQALPLETLGEMAVPLAVLAIVIALMTPLPSFVLDLLIATDILLSVTVLMVSLYLTRPVEFTSFPTTLLLLTLFRLALNISSSRLILLNGNTGTSAAGEVIGAFGSFVVGGNYVIGTVIFLVLIAIQYVVINHGAVRISEVTARFTLDALPGKQMSIDSDLNGGLIDEAEAKRRRKQLATEAEFYGAMDGASRFTQRDAVASILITAINIIAGFLIGVLQHGMDFMKALQTYTVLTIGDGLVTVIPALMISISGGLIVTRASSDARLGTEFHKQIFGNSQPLLLAAGVLCALAVLPGMPKLPFLLLGGGAGAAGWRIRRREVETKTQAVADSKPAAAKENLESLMRVEPLAIEVGLGLVGLVEGGQESPLLRRISSIRRQMATDLGYLLPPVRVTDNLSLRSREYVISLKGVEISRYELPQGCELAIPLGGAEPPGEGQPTREPAFGMKAFWVPAERAERARQAGCTMVDPVSVLGTHLSELIRRHAHELFSRQDAKRLLDRVGVEHSKAVEDLVPKLLPLATVQKVLQNLLRETGHDSGRGIYPGSPGRRSRVLAECRAADRVRAAGDPAVGSEALPEPLRRPAGLVPRSVDRAGRGAGGRARRAEQPPDTGAAGHQGPAEPDRDPRPFARNAGGGDYFLGSALFPAADRGTDPAEPVLPRAQRDSSGAAGAVVGEHLVARAAGRLVRPYSNGRILTINFTCGYG